MLVSRRVETVLTGGPDAPGGPLGPIKPYGRKISKS